ncbi:hypothetical protein GSI_00146 [Ganoderma sinense ZZ0214-1]|uniref:Uncharacterized protein n=1 Tax=Ganoderma sinense ZZ0214-1 TaxID=1077348 RepID=A0A2G8SRR2_9APHY|nr:hypothetical protein GSI_00146 [Ganoderma sinense ZZ0214-1]
MVITESPMIQKLSVATQPAKLEIDSAGRLVKEPTQHERIESLLQFYKADEKSDDIPSAGDSEAFYPIEITSPSVGPSNVAVPRSGHKGKQREHNNVGRSASSIKASTPPGSDVLDLASTDSKLLFDAAFGTSDDELSEFTDEETPLPRSKILRRTSTTTSIPGRISFEPTLGKNARLARGGVGKVVLDSDDEASLAPAQKRFRNLKKALIRAPTMDTVATEDRAASLPGLGATTTSDVSTPSSQTKGEVLVPATTSGRRSTTSKVLRFSDVHIPAPDFNAALSSPPTVPTSVLKSALVKKLPKPPPSVQDSSPCVSAPVAAKKPAAVQASEVLDDLIPASSSPTPGAKKPVKVSMAKNDQPIADPPLLKPVKRKAVVVMEPDDDDDDVPLASLKNAAARPTKRARSSPDKSPVAPKAKTKPALKSKESPPKQRSDHDSLALRPPMRPRRRYHARKGRTSSPQPAPGDSSGSAPVSTRNCVDVDYDELPTSPPKRSAASGAAGKSSSTAPKTNLELVKKAAKASKDVIKDGVEKVEKATDQTTVKKAKPGKTVKAEKANKPTKTENTNKARAVKTPPENSTQSMKLEKPRDGATARKDDATSKTSAKAKTKAQKPGDSTKESEVAKGDVLEDEVAESGPPRRPRPRKAGAGTTKAKKDDVAVPAIVTATEPDLVAGSLPPERATARTYEKSTNMAVVDTNDTANVAIIAADGPRSSDIIEFTFLDDVEPPQPEIVFSDPSIIGNSSSSSSKPAASKPKPPKPKSAKAPWDAMAQSVQPPRSPADSPPQDEVVTVLAEDHAKAPALAVTTPADCLKDRGSTEDIAPTSMASAGIEKREMAVQTAGVTMSSTPQVEQQPVVIDLTLDSPRSPVRKSSRPKVISVGPPDRALDTTVSAFLEDAPSRPEHIHTAKERLPQPIEHYHAVRFTSPAELPSMHARSAFGRERTNEMSAEAEGDETLVDIGYGSGDPSLDAIVDVLNKLHQVRIHSISNRFEGVRQEVRAGRDELLRYATADLHTLHAQSVTHFNRLIDLEAEYARVGRNVLHGNEDWVNVNQQVCDTLAAAVEKHDRGMLSKQMPATLVTLKLL